MSGFQERLLKEVQSLQAAMARLEGILGRGTVPPARVVPERPLILADIRTTAKGKRFPYEVQLTGAVEYSVSVSPIRVAILAVLFKDLQDRLSGGNGLSNKQELIRKFAGRLGVEVTDAAVKTALYRFDVDFIKDLSAASGTMQLKYNSPKVALQVVDANGRFATQMIVDVRSPVATVEQVLQELLPASPLAQARSRKVLYVPGGPAGFDRLFLELFDHPYPMREESLFFKPSIITYPDDLLNFIQASREDRLRRDAALKGFHERRCRFREILRRTTLRDLITHTSKDGFLLYPPTVTQRHVEDHLCELMRMVRECPGYVLTLTDAPLPFLLSLFEIESGSQPEAYTVFFRQLLREHDPDINCFLINDATILWAVRKHVIAGVVTNPSTTDDPRTVEQEIKEVLRTLQDSGPLTARPSSDQ
jgi:hypothetical protein